MLYTDPSQEVTAAVARALGETRSEGEYLGMQVLTERPIIRRVSLRSALPRTGAKADG